MNPETYQPGGYTNFRVFNWIGPRREPEPREATAPHNLAVVAFWRQLEAAGKVLPRKRQGKP